MPVVSQVSDLVYYNDIDKYACQVLSKLVSKGLLPNGFVDHSNIALVDPAKVAHYKNWHLFAGIGGFAYGLHPDLKGVLTAGWPCQPHSYQGQRKGYTDDNERWPDLYRFITEIRPKWFIGENVTGVLTSNGGRYFRTILSDLARIGYNAEWSTISACTMGATHSRKRLFLLAYPYSKRCEKYDFATCIREVEGPNPWSLAPLGAYWSNQSEPARVSNGLSDRLDTQRVRLLGNSLVPQIVAVISRALLEYQKLLYPEEC
jgi:site-specific DNA-cytosine methylase